MECYKIYKIVQEKILSSHRKGCYAARRAAKDKILNASFWNSFSDEYQGSHDDPQECGGSERACGNIATTGQHQGTGHDLGGTERRLGREAGAEHLGKVRVELCESVSESIVSGLPRIHGLRGMDEFGGIFSANIPTHRVDWKDCDTSEEIQSSLYAFLDRGILILYNIPKVPEQYEPKGRIKFYGIDSEDNSLGVPHFFQFATRDEVYIASNFKMLARYVVNELGLAKNNHIVWGTNIEYELGNIVKDWTVDKKFCDIKWTKAGLKKFELKYIPKAIGWGDDKTDREGLIKVWDTLSHWKMTVKDIGDKLSVHLGYDFNKLHQDFYSLKYAAMDAILSRSYACIQQNYYNNKGVALRFTPGATALGFYMNGTDSDGNKLCKHHLYGTHKDSELHWLISGLRGGRTEVFSLKEYQGTVGYYDINSAYPFAMKYGCFPHPSRHHWSYGHKQIEVELDCGYEGMIECEIDASKVIEFTQQIPYLGTKDITTGRFIFPLGRWIDKYTAYEIRQAQELGYKFSYIKGLMYEPSEAQPFAKFVDFCYAIRDEGTEKKDPILRDIGKSLGNNLFGKFGQRLNFTEVEDPENYKAEDITSCVRIGRSVLINKDDGFAPHTNVIWSAYVTAICRDLLYKHMATAWANGNEIIYCDTDSIFIHGGRPPESHQTRLGALKHEGDLSYFRALLPKTYIYELGGKRIYKAKGIPKELKSKDAKGNEVIVNLREMFFTKGQVEYRKPLKIREAFRRKNIKEEGIETGMNGVNAWITIKKELKGKYTKRIADSDGSTRPHVLNQK